MDNILKKIFTITKIEGIKKKDTGEVIGMNVFEDDKTKYSFFLKKQDLTPTKASTQFKSQGIMVGSSVGIAYKEEPREYTYKDKKTGETKTAIGSNRKILWFAEPKDMEEYAQSKEIVIDGPDDDEVIEDFDLSKIPF